MHASLSLSQALPSFSILSLPSIPSSPLILFLFHPLLSAALPPSFFSTH